MRAESEKQDKSICIFHVDVNSAFLSWSALKRLKDQPGSVDLRTIPSAVGGDIKTRHGVITAKSIPAKKYGVKTGEPVVQALAKCPQLVLVRSDFTTYRSYSHAFIRILHEYSDLVEQVSIDEAYLDMTGVQNPQEVADRLRAEIRQKLGFTVNVGISSNKLLAKTASDFEKPDKTHTLWQEEVPGKLWSLPIGELHGCGRATARRLGSMGILTIGDAAHTDPAVLKAALGNKAGTYIFESANGRGSTVIHGQAEDAKSYSNETTTAVDITRDNYQKEALPIIRYLSGKVSKRLKRDGFRAGTIAVSVKTDDFKRHSRQRVLAESTDEEDTICRTAGQLIEDLLLSPEGLFAKGHSVRLMGVGALKLDTGEFRQMNLFDYLKDRKAEQKKAKLDGMMDEISRRYGENALKKGIDGT